MENLELKGSNFIKIKWCDLCNGIYVECPKCGNNSCNGGYGKLPTGEKCNCSKSYELMYAIEENEKIRNLVYELIEKERK